MSAHRQPITRFPSPNHCAIREFPGDGISVGRCWHHVPDRKCPRHGDVRAVQDHYARTGELTDERKR